MNRRSERNARRPIFLLLALLLCATVGMAHQRVGHDPVTGVVRDAALVPAQTFSKRVGDWCNVHLFSLTRGPRLASENAALRVQVQTMTRQNQTLRALQDENARLRLLLDFQKKSPRKLLAAEAIARSPTARADTLTLSRGARDGIRAHSVALAPNGALIGQVLEATGRSCDVLLLTDSNSSIGAQVVGKAGTRGLIGLCQGGQARGLRLTYLGADADVRVGDSVVTSGLGGIFPPGLPLGTVQSIVADRTRSMKTAILRPAADFDHLDEAFLIP